MYINRRIELHFDAIIDKLAEKPEKLNILL